METTFRSYKAHTVGTYIDMISNEPHFMQEAILIQLMRQLSKPSDAQSAKSKSNEDTVMQLCGAWNEDSRSTQQIKDDIRNARVSGDTRHINGW